MRNIRIIRSCVMALAALLVVTMIGGTWAYSWTQELQVTNEFELGKYSTSIVEVFDSPTGWQPGVDVNKDVSITNKGTVPTFVKVVIGQEWLKLGANGTGSSAYPISFDVNSGKEYAALVTWGKDVVLLSAGKTPTASLSLGLPTVSSVEEAKGKWLLLSETPDASGNYTFYYVGLLDAGKTTPLLVDSVKMNPNIQAEIIEENTVWDKAAQKWVTTTKDNAQSYENARYTMHVTMNTVQATAAAVKEMFKADNTSEQTVVSYMETLGIRASDIASSYDDSLTTKKLYFDVTTGDMTFSAVRGSSEYWFMSHLNMIPGGTYSDTLDIENKSSKTYNLYMQVVPINQEKLPDELLALIHMKVYYGSSNMLIYDGTALGKSYSGSLHNLQNVILLGTYSPNVAGKIKVELTLDKDTPLAYQGLLTNINWKFMVEDKTVTPTPTPTVKPTITPTPTVKPTITPTVRPTITPTPTVRPTITPTPTPTVRPTITPVPTARPWPTVSCYPDGPKTGDNADNTWYVMLMSISGALLVGCIIFLVATRENKRRPDWN